MSAVSQIVIRVTRSAADLPLPAYQTAGSAGMDLVASVSDDVAIAPGAWALIGTGLHVAIPPGFEGQVRPRSGLALKHGITVLNAPGTIDSDYRGEVKVALINHGREPFVVRRGERIAQLVICAVTRASWNEVIELDTTERGHGGYGSTGR
ncbi:MAG: dUTP diphosphatase [Polyangiaceae bacterium]|nr:dUTP diphosphatase [Polyangiaceae bacterium]